jgi:hypothetical protein
MQHDQHFTFLVVVEACKELELWELCVEVVVPWVQSLQCRGLRD